MPKKQGLDQRIQQVLKSKKRDAKWLADQIGLSLEGTRQVIARGSAPYPTVFTIATVLDVRPGWLHTGDGEQTDSEPSKASLDLAREIDLLPDWGQRTIREMVSYCQDAARAREQLPPELRKIGLMVPTMTRIENGD